MAQYMSVSRAPPETLNNNALHLPLACGRGRLFGEPVASLVLEVRQYTRARIILQSVFSSGSKNRLEWLQCKPSTRGPVKYHSTVTFLRTPRILVGREDPGHSRTNGKEHTVEFENDLVNYEAFGAKGDGVNDVSLSEERPFPYASCRRLNVRGLETASGMKPRISPSEGINAGVELKEQC